MLLQGWLPCQRGNCNLATLLLKYSLSLYRDTLTPAGLQQLLPVRRHSYVQAYQIWLDARRCCRSARAGREPFRFDAGLRVSLVARRRTGAKLGRLGRRLLWAAQLAVRP